MEIEIRTLTLPSMRVAAVRDVIGSYDQEGRLWQQLAPQVYRNPANIPADAICGDAFYDEEYQDSDVDVEVWQQVSDSFVPQPPVTRRQVDARDVVCATLLGSYDQVPAATAALGEYVAGHGLVTGAMFSICRVGPAQDQDPAHWVTDICLPLVQGRGGENGQA